MKFKHQIVLYTTIFAFLWSIGYSSVVSYRFQDKLSLVENNAEHDIVSQDLSGFLFFNLVYNKTEESSEINIVQKNINFILFEVPKIDFNLFEVLYSFKEILVNHESHFISTNCKLVIKLCSLKLPF